MSDDAHFSKLERMYLAAPINKGSTEQVRHTGEGRCPDP